MTLRTEDSEHEDFLRASRALTRFRGLCGGLTTVARACSGDDRVRVSPGANSCTDGKTIWLRPAIELGDNITHERRYCGKRHPETLVMICAACARDDKVLAVAHHEIAHIAFESFGRNDLHRLDGWRKRARDHGIDPNVVDQAAREGGYLPLAKMVNVHFPWAFNALEDVRVNARMVDERPGFAKMLAADRHSLISEGIDDGAGGRLFWYEQPGYLQAGVAAYALAEGSMDEWRPALPSPEAQIVFDDPVCREITEQVLASDETYAVMDLAEKLVDRFVELGILPEPEEDPGEGGGRGTIGEPCDDGEPGENGTGDGTDDGDSDDDSDGDGSDSGDEQGENGAGKSEDEQIADEMERVIGIASGHPDGKQERSDFDSEKQKASGVGGGSSSHNDQHYEDQTFEVAIQQGRDFDEPSVEVSGVREREIDESISSGWWNHFSTSRQAEESERKGVLEIVPGVVGPGVSRLRKVFDKNAASSYTSNLRKGRVGQKGLARKIANGDGRVFEKKRHADKRSYHVVVMLDMSGSTRDSTLDRARNWASRTGERTPTKRDVFQYPDGSVMTVFDSQKHLAVHLGDMFDRLGVSFEVYGHTAGMETTYINGARMDSLDVMPVKRPGQVWSREAKHRLGSLQGAAGNLDGHAMEFARKCAQKSDATDKIIIYISDGEMPAMNYTEELHILQRECKWCLAQPDIHLVGIGIHCDSPKEHGLDTVVVNTANDLTRVFTKLERLMT